jgi:hypothetical protein
MNDPVDIVRGLRLLGTGVLNAISSHHMPLMIESADLIEKLRDENERLQALLTPVRHDTDPQTDPSYPKTVDDVLSLLSAYIADFLPDEVCPGDEYYAAWERQARPVIEHIMQPPKLIFKQPEGRE